MRSVDCPGVFTPVAPLGSTPSPSRSRRPPRFRFPGLAAGHAAGRRGWTYIEIRGPSPCGGISHVAQERAGGDRVRGVPPPLFIVIAQSPRFPAGEYGGTTLLLLA